MRIPGGISSGLGLKEWNNKDECKRKKGLSPLILLMYDQRPDRKNQSAARAETIAAFRLFCTVGVNMCYMWFITHTHHSQGLLLWFLLCYCYTQE